MRTDDEAADGAKIIGCAKKEKEIILYLQQCVTQTLFYRYYYTKNI